MGEYNIKKIIRLAGVMNDMLEWSERTDGTKFVRVKGGLDKLGHWVYDVVRAGNGDGWLDDTVFEFAWAAASSLSEVSSSGDEDDLREAIYQMEPDIYTNDLTEWLHRRPDHVYYMTQAQEEFGATTDGFQLLSAAQKFQMDEVGMAVLEALNEVDDSEEFSYIVISQVGVREGKYASVYTLPQITLDALDALADKHDVDFYVEEEFHLANAKTGHDWFDIDDAYDDDDEDEPTETIAIRVTITVE